MPDEAQLRKLRSEEILRREGVPINDWLPVIETKSEARFRTKEDIAHRAMALCLVATKAEGLHQASPQEVARTVKWIMDNFGVAPFLSPAETRFIATIEPSEQEIAQFVWRYEAYWVLLWALGYIETLGRPDSGCDLAQSVQILRTAGPQGFVRDARLRSADDLLAAADLIFRYHWATRVFELRGEEPPAGLAPDVVMERHHALNWLVGAGGDEWDDVDTST